VKTSDPTCNRFLSLIREEEKGEEESKDIKTIKQELIK
jgi:hypothetical protein